MGVFPGGGFLGFFLLFLHALHVPPGLFQVVLLHGGAGGVVSGTGNWGNERTKANPRARALATVFFTGIPKK